MGDSEETKVEEATTEPATEETAAEIPPEEPTEKGYKPPAEDPNEGKGETNPEGVVDNPDSVKAKLGYNPGDQPKKLYDENYNPPTDRALNHVDVLASQGLVEIWDPTIDNGYEIDKETGQPDPTKPKPQGAFRQVSKVAAQKMLDNLEALKKSLEGTQ
jgi:hypothetical protein